MARGRYHIWQEEGRWHVRHQGMNVSFETPSAALKAAIAEAYKAGEKGFSGQVLVQNSSGEWKVEWTYGDSPAPLAA
jgi:hypothetical protein